ncbi:MAG: GGDEF domain-containing protein [Treponema sp.]|nr:GGDEF domain-containing protein [Treponema sp.]
MNEENLSAIEIYMNRVFKLVILAAPGATLCAGLTYTAIKFLGFYPMVSMLALLIFDSTCLLYFITAILFVRHCETPDGYLKPNIIKYGKIFLAILEIIQWNFISYLIPCRDFWAYGAFFILFAVFFLDHKYTLLISAEIALSLIASWFIKGDTLLPAHDELFIPNLIIRAVNIFLVVLCLWLITYLVQKRLAHELEKLADYDALTLLHNRRSMKTHISNVMKQAEKGEGTFTLLMCDLDNFKRVNDTFGHDCGDLILKTVANIISCDVKKDDMVFRYGGEEILVMVLADPEITGRVAERIRSDVANEKITYNDKNVGITITIGVAGYKPNATVDELIKIADDKLYFGKNNGKNQVVNE